MKRKLIALILAMITACAVANPAYAADLDIPISDLIETRYEAVAWVTSSLTVNSYTVSSRCDYYLKSFSDYDYKINMTLEQSSNQKDWDEETSWSTTPTSRSGSFTKSYVPASGYYYRTVTTIDVYTKSGAYVETAEAASVARYF